MSQHRTEPYRKGSHRHLSQVYDPNNRAHYHHGRGAGPATAMDPGAWTAFDLDLTQVQAVTQVRAGIPADTPLPDGCARVFLVGGAQVTLMDTYPSFIRDVWEPWLAEKAEWMKKATS